MVLARKLCEDVAQLALRDRFAHRADDRASEPLGLAAIADLGSRGNPVVELLERQLGDARSGVLDRFGELLWQLSG